MKKIRVMFVCLSWNIAYIGISRQALAGSVTLKPRSTADYKKIFQDIHNPEGMV
jgi:hypothetical protein